MNTDDDLAENMFRTDPQIRAILDERVGPVLDVKIGIHVSGEGQPRSQARRWLAGANCRNICWSILVIMLAVASIIMAMLGQVLSNSSTGRVVDTEETAAIARSIPAPATTNIQPGHSDLVDALLRQKQRRLRYSIDLAFTFADQARDLDSQGVIGNDPGLRRAIEGLPKRSDSMIFTLGDRLRTLCHELQDMVDALDHVTLTVADAHSRMDNIEKDSASGKRSLLRKLWWRKTDAYISLQMRIDTVLVLGNRTAPLVHSLEGQITAVSATINAFHGDVKRLCSSYENPDSYITLQARLLMYKSHTDDSLQKPTTKESYGPDEPTLDRPCPGPSLSRDAVISAGDAMAAMSAFCGEITQGIAQTLVLNDEYGGGGADDMNDDELLGMLKKKVGAAVEEHEDLLSRTRYVTELV